MVILSSLVNRTKSVGLYVLLVYIGSSASKAAILPTLSLLILPLPYVCCVDRMVIILIGRCFLTCHSDSALLFLVP